MKLLCFIGFHKWNIKRVVEYRMEYVTAFFESEVCERCKKHKISPEKLTRGLPKDYIVLNT